MNIGIRVLVSILVSTVYILPALADVNLDASTFVGVIGSDRIRSSAIAADGDIYVAGNTDEGVRWQNANVIGVSADMADTFLAKLSTDLTSYRQITLFDGFEVSAVAVSKSGDVYVAGSDKEGAVDLDNWSMEIRRFDASLNSILSSFTFEGNGAIDVNDMAILANGSVVLVGETYANSIPIHSGSFDGVCGLDGNSICDSDDSRNHSDGFIVVVDASLSNIERATYVGDDNDDNLAGVLVSPEGDIFVHGEVGHIAQGSSFPISSNAYYTIGGGSFIGRFSADLMTLKASTFWHQGNPFYRLAINDMVVSSSSLYITGGAGIGVATHDTAFQENFSGPACNNCSYSPDAYIAKFDLDLSGVDAATYFGLEEDQRGDVISADSDGNIVIAGRTDSTGGDGTPSMPLEGPFDSSYTGFSDLFVAVFDKNLDSLLGSSFLGGSFVGSNFSETEAVTDIVISSANQIFLAGFTSSPTFPVTAGVVDTVCGDGDCDYSFYGQFLPLQEGFVSSISVSGENICQAATISPNLIMSFPVIQGAGLSTSAQFSFIEEIAGEFRFRLTQAADAPGNGCTTQFTGTELQVPQLQYNGDEFSVRFSVAQHEDGVFGFRVLEMTPL